jgi:SAM-dependent methyltransferase
MKWHFENLERHPRRTTGQGLRREAFSRLDGSDDPLFYAKDRFVDHLDTLALATVEQIIGDVITQTNPVILDLMAGWNSHIPDRLRPSRMVGLGLNENELRQNKVLSEHLMHDLNRDPRLPFPAETFDAVINTVSIDYMTRPVEVFSAVANILKKRGLLLVIFSNRMFPQKAVKIWKESSEEESSSRGRVLPAVGAFGETTVIVSRGKPRPKEDKSRRSRYSKRPCLCGFMQGGSEELPAQTMRELSCPLSLPFVF